MAGKKKPTIDERLDALAQSVELIARMQLQTEREISRFARLARMVGSNHEKRISKLERGRR